MNKMKIDSTNPADLDRLMVDLIKARGADRTELMTAIANHGKKELVFGLLARALMSVDGLVGQPQDNDFESSALRVTVAALTDDAELATLALHDGAASVPGLLALTSELAQQLAAARVELSGGDRERTLAELRQQLLRIEAQDEGGE